MATPAAVVKTSADRTRAHWAGALVASGLALFLFARVLAGLGGEWWRNEDYSHGLLVPFVLAYLVYEKRSTWRSLVSQGSWWGGMLLAASLAVYLVGFLGAEFFLQRTAFVGVCAGAILLFGGWRLLQESFFALVLLLMAIPLPTLVFNVVALPLQLIASTVSERVLELLNIPVFREGNVLQLANMTLSVAEACSGIRSLMSLLTIALLAAYFLPYRMWLRGVVVITAVPIAIAANAFRVAGTGVLARYYGERAAQGFFHTFSGWLVFIGAATLLFVEIGLIARLIPGSWKEERA